MAAKKAKKTIVIGHKNPDTDSICSAICYANLKQLLTGQQYIPAGRDTSIQRRSSCSAILMFRHRS